MLNAGLVQTNIPEYKNKKRQGFVDYLNNTMT